jgi:hypothetical protein
MGCEAGSRERTSEEMNEWSTHSGCWVAKGTHRLGEPVLCRPGALAGQQ